MSSIRQTPGEPPSAPLKVDGCHVPADMSTADSCGASKTASAVAVAGPLLVTVTVSTSGCSESTLPGGVLAARAKSACGGSDDAGAGMDMPIPARTTTTIQVARMARA